MSPHERRLAENEVTLLKVLNGPTIIHYYEHYTKDDTIYIIMEYAEKGSLSDRISDHKMKGAPISNDQVQFFLDYSILSSLDLRLDCSACYWYSVNAFQEYPSQRYQISKYVLNKG